MSRLADKISEDLINAMKSKDEVAVSTLRMLSASLKNAQIAKGGELTEEEVLAQIARGAKQHRESIEAYKKGGRSDLSQKESAELKVLESYLPEQMSRAQIDKIVEETIAASGASGLGDMGKVMGQVMARIGGQADGNIVSEAVRTRLAK